MPNLIDYVERLVLGIALEASAFPKPGNIHRLRDFDDTIYEDFIVTAITAIKPLYKGVRRGYRYHDMLDILKNIFGDIIYDIVLLSKYTSGGGNTCLGTSIMLSPISIGLGCELALSNSINIERILLSSCRNLEKYSTILDAINLYRAIRAASPSYIKKTDNTHNFPNIWSRDFKKEIIKADITLWKILSYSSSFDIVARDVIECYPRTYNISLYIDKRLNTHGIWNRAIVEAYLYQLSKEIDTLVIRKNGYEVAQEVKERAKEFLKICEDSWTFCVNSLKDFDLELASRKINPGSTADIVATAISIYSLSRWRSILRIS